MAIEEEPPAFYLTETDRQVLAQTDEEFIYHDWKDLQDIIARGNLGILKRKPSDLIRYLKWTNETKAQYGLITNYICLRRLGWQLPTETAADAPLPFNNPIPFADPADYKILRNDWPYGLAKGISHLVVWLRTPIPVKDGEEVITEESRNLIDAFIERTFVARLAEDKEIRFVDPKSHVLWFKNYTALQSVRGLEHIHVLLKEVPDRLLHEWTGE
ncbi:GIG1 family protein [Aspergillus lucknowensis]|uniref:N-acetylglucosamine-induced protein 1 n=1 Tax=Aspergillus lucknowensis TaxID=176173 RepID=A0ABR4LGB5_9EURO